MRVFPLCRRIACGIVFHPSIRLRFTPARPLPLPLFARNSEHAYHCRQGEREP